MAYLSDAVASVSNSPTITISMWVRLPQACNVNLLEFGNPIGDDNAPSNYIFVANDGTQGNFVGAQFRSVIDSFSTITAYLTTTDEANDGDWQVATDPLNNWTAHFGGTTTGVGSIVDPGNWCQEGLGCRLRSEEMV